MLDLISKIFDIVRKIVGIYSMVVSIIEIDYGELEGSEKEKKAIEWLASIVDEQVEEGNIPLWVKEIFFTEIFMKWIIAVVVKAAHKLGIFIRKEEKKTVAGE